MALKTYTQMLAEIAALWPDNLKKQITAATARTTLNDLLDSAFTGGGASNAADPGNDGILIIGDSTLGNAHSFVASRDVPVPNRVLQWNQVSRTGFPANTINPATEPLQYADQVTAGLVGSPLPFARRLILDRPTNRPLVLLPQAIVGTGLSNTFTVIGGLGQNQGWAPPNKTAQCDIFCVNSAGASAGSQGDQVIINGVTLTSIAGPNAGLNFQYSAVSQTYAQNLRDCINTNKVAMGLATPSSVTNSLFTVFAAAPGSAGNYVCDGTKVGSFFSFYFDAIDVNNGYGTAAFGARLVGGSDGSGGTSYAAAISQANAFIAAAPAGTTNRIIGILCGVGTNDTRMSDSQFQTWYLGMIDGLRAGITNGSNLPFVAIPPVPEYALNIGGVGPGDFLKNKFSFLLQLGNLKNFTACAQPAYGSQDSVAAHPDAITSIYSGSVLCYDAYNRATGNEVAAARNNALFLAGPVINVNFFYTVQPLDVVIINTSAAGVTTVTLPNPANSSGRVLILKTTVAFTTVSDKANVVPLIGGAAGTAILAATAGKWAALQADGISSWHIIAGN